MEACICTLFEGNYHFGVSALTNSLFAQGFRGSVYAGYRGQLPSWALGATLNPNLNWEGATTLKVDKDLNIHFLPLVTDYHLTNYKPDFMLKLWDGIAGNVEAMFYFDPDIVLCAPWAFLEKWVNCGVALCEDVNSPLTNNHPIRNAWRKYFRNYGLQLSFKNQIYVNGGFVGVIKRDKSFLSTWKSVQEAMAPAIGGLKHSALAEVAEVPKEADGAFAPFYKTDQDALNANIEAWEGETSLLAKEAMGFINGSTVMYHALDTPKPWNRSQLGSALKGIPPRAVDKEYWKHTNGPIKPYSTSYLRIEKMMIGITVFIGRFYKK
jgi:hypothetical protein